MRYRSDYALTALGAVIGGWGLSSSVTMGVGRLLPPDAVAWGLILFAVSVLLGWVGAGVGVWIALRLGKQPHAARTAAITVGLLPALSVIMIPVLSTLAYLLSSDTILLVLGFLIVLLTSLAARWLATRQRALAARHEGV